jgi:hypothetical protein
MSRDGDRATSPSTKPFRFKEKKSADNESDSSASQKRKRSSRAHRHRHHHSTSHRKKRQRREEPSERSRSDYTSGLNPDDAFRESLFDAMGDDEGANFWEGVYGQPIHNYPNQFINEDTGELETMDDEEYAQYVRRKMWERSREGVEAAREEKRKATAKKKAEEQHEAREQHRKLPESTTGGPYNNFVFDFEIEASLKRGKQRRDRKHWQQLWKNYLLRWDQLQDFARSRDLTTKEDNLFLRNKIIWPVESGKRKDVNAEAIEHFIRQAAISTGEDGDARDTTLAVAVKAERVRWHPDKVQQRYGFMDIDESTMQGVTATFQVLDRLWNELRSTKI